MAAPVCCALAGTGDQAVLDYRLKFQRRNESAWVETRFRLVSTPALVLPRKVRRPRIKGRRVVPVAPAVVPGQEPGQPADRPAGKQALEPPVGVNPGPGILGGEGPEHRDQVRAGPPDQSPEGPDRGPAPKGLAMEVQGRLAGLVTVQPALPEFGFPGFGVAGPAIHQRMEGDIGGQVGQGPEAEGKPLGPEGLPVGGQRPERGKTVVAPDTVEPVGGGLGPGVVEDVIGAVVGHGSGINQFGVPEGRVGQGTRINPGDNPPGQVPVGPFLRHGEPSRG